MTVNGDIYFIQKALEKTKQKSLHWLILPEDFKIKLLPDENTPNTSILFDSFSLSLADSYVAEYQTGQLLLLVKIPKLIDYPVTPPDKCILSLRMQDSQSRFAIEIANSDSSNDIATALVRLYNLIDKDTSSIHNLIHDFLNS